MELGHNYETPGNSWIPILGVVKSKLDFPAFQQNRLGLFSFVLKADSVEVISQQLDLK